LPVTELRTRDAQPVGWLLGLAIDDRGDLFGGVQTVPFAAPAQVEGELFEQWLYGLGGRFLAVLLANDLRRVYLDPAGTLAAVYDATEPAVASTETLLVGDTRPMRGPLQPNQFFPAGLTAYPHLRRLLPNHYLDLDRWRPVRHWLTASLPRATAAEVPGLVETIAGVIRRQVQAVTRRWPAYLGLTAGRDSRMILACSRDFVDQLTCITFDYQEKPSDLTDVHAACILARHLRLRHQIVPIKAPTDELQASYLRRIGHAGHFGKARDFDYACRMHLDLSRALLTGFAGEVGRSFYWRKFTGASPEPGAGELLRAMLLPAEEPLLTALVAWRAGLQPEDTWALLDQMYLEQRVGCWAAPHFYGAAPFAAKVTPFCHRQIFAAMLRLPIDYRASQSLATDLIRLTWPELGAWPFNDAFADAKPFPLAE
jgi:hypothetical protein